MDQPAMESYVMKISDLSKKHSEMLEKVKEALQMTASLLDQYEKRIIALEEWRNELNDGDK